MNEAPFAPEVLRQLESRLHALICKRAAEFTVTNMPAKPSLSAVDMPTREHPAWFPAPGMYDGFEYWLDASKEPVRLVCDSWCRVVGDSEQRHEITTQGIRQVE